MITFVIQVAASPYNLVSTHARPKAVIVEQFVETRVVPVFQDPNALMGAIAHANLIALVRIAEAIIAADHAGRVSTKTSVIRVFAYRVVLTLVHLWAVIAVKFAVNLAERVLLIGFARMVATANAPQVPSALGRFFATVPFAIPLRIFFGNVRARHGLDGRMQVLIAIT